MVFGSRGEWTYRGALVFLACGMNPLFRLEISWNLRYCVKSGGLVIPFFDRGWYFVEGEYFGKD